MRKLRSQGQACTEGGASPKLMTKSAVRLNAIACGEGRAILADAKRLWRDYVPASRHLSDHRWPMYAGLVKRDLR